MTTAAADLVAIIPARSGSKRLPGKNIRRFFGHPLLAYSIAAALNSSLFKRVIVSSDDPETGEIAEWYGAEYLPRPAELAGDRADLVEVAIHVLATMSVQGFHPRALCQLIPTCPLRRSEDILSHYRLFKQGRRFQISTVTYRGVYPHWALVQDEQGVGRPLWGKDYLAGLSQDFGQVYCPTGAIWWARLPDFLEQKNFYGDPFHLAPMDDNRGLDIDRSEDLELAETLVFGLQVRHEVSPLEAIHVSPFLGK